MIDKKTKDKFIELVEKCQEGISKQNVCTFGRCLCRYILAYIVLEDTKDNTINKQPLQLDNGDTVDVPEMSCQLVERLVKPKKSHRNIKDSEKKFMQYTFPLMKKASVEINNEEA